MSARQRRLALTLGAVLLALAAAAALLVRDGGTSRPPAAALAAADLAGWTAYPDPSAQDGAVCIRVPTAAEPYDAALEREVRLVAGERYRLAFRARAAPALQGPVRVVVQDGDDGGTLLPPGKPSFGPRWEDYEYVFTAPRDAPAALLALQQDGANALDYTLCVRDLVLEPAPATSGVPDDGTRVRVNQVGYLPRGPKGATLVTAQRSPVPWVLRRQGQVVATGTTTPRGVDEAVGLPTHTVDFSSVVAPGRGYVLEADGETSHPFAIGERRFEQLRRDAKTYFATQRSGAPIDDEVVPGYGRAAGHVGVPPNRGDTDVPCQDLDDDAPALLVAPGDDPWTCEGTADVSGGWYDAGDHGKYVVSGAVSAAQLMQEHERSLRAAPADAGALGDGTLRVPERDNGVPDVLDEVRWELEWFLRMQVEPEQPLAGRVFHKVADDDWTDVPTDPAADPRQRVLSRPSTAATLGVAATAAQGARVFAPHDERFSARLLAAARTAYTAALTYREHVAPPSDASLDPDPGSGAYADRVLTDERYWAATELYLTTGEQSYLDDLLGSPLHRADVFLPAGFDWGNVAPLAQLDLATVPSGLPAAELAAVRASVVAGAGRYLATAADQPFAQPYAPDDGRWVWGSNGQVLNNAQVVGTAYDLTGEPRYRDGVVRALDHVLGRNALGLSYVTGYGDVFAQHQHSRQYAAPLDPDLPRPPDGSLAGGPNSTAVEAGDPVAERLFEDGCPAQTCYVDDVESFATNEIALNWNAPLSWVASFVADLDRGDDGSRPTAP